MIIKRNKSFLKSYLKLTKKLQDKTDSTLIIFSKNPFEKKLENHALNWEYEFIELLKVWTHSQLYW